ncbi:Fc.00g011710.m01.CDS01 [Cosmosporella sp. VM-42]
MTTDYPFADGFVVSNNDPYKLASPINSALEKPSKAWEKVALKSRYLKWAREQEDGVDRLLNHLEINHWPALDHWNSHEIASDLPTLNKWLYGDFKAMMEWYRLLLALPLPVPGRNDGMWRLVLENSPFWYWEDFKQFTHKEMKDHNGNPVKDHDGKKVLIRRTNDEVQDWGLENAFYAKWWEIVNTRACKRFENGLIVTPYTCDRYERKENLTWSTLRDEEMDRRERRPDGK